MDELRQWHLNQFHCTKVVIFKYHDTLHISTNNPGTANRLYMFMHRLELKKKK